MDMTDDEFRSFLDTLSPLSSSSSSAGKGKGKRKSSGDEDATFVPETDEDDEDAEDEILDEGEVTVAAARVNYLPRELVPVDVLEKNIADTAMLREITWFADPKNYVICRNIIISQYHCPTAAPSFFAGERLCVSVDLLWEMTRYFQGAISGSKRDMELAMSKVGTIISGRVIPKCFCIGYTGQAMTFFVPRPLFEYMTKKFVPVTEAELLKKPKKQQFKGTRSFLNFGKCYVPDRPFPDCEEAAVIAELAERGFVRDVHTGFIVFGLEKCDLWKHIGADETKKLEAPRKRAQELNGRAHGYKTPTLPLAQIPKTARELAVCVVFDVTSKMLVLFPSFEEHANMYVRFDRDRPRTTSPFVTADVK